VNAPAEPPVAPQSAPPVAVASAPPITSPAADRGQAAFSPKFAGPQANVPRKGPGLPTWLLTVIFALVFVGVVFGIYRLINHNPSKPTAAVENPAAKPGSPANPIQRYIEVSGVRFMEDPKHKDQVLVRFMVTNHSSADLNGLAGNVTLWASTRRSEEDTQGSLSFKTDIRPNESKELTEPLVTKKKIYELPDWQMVTTDLQITAPAQ
jgi:hypothetical protein